MAFLSSEIKTREGGHVAPTACVDVSSPGKGDMGLVCEQAWSFMYMFMEKEFMILRQVALCLRERCDVLYSFVI